MQLRQYQKDAANAVIYEWKIGHKKTLLTLPTGTGKTIVFGAIADYRAKCGRRTLIMAHRDELLTQAADKLKKAFDLDSALEKAESSSLDSTENVTIGSVQSMTREKRLEKFPTDYFDDIIVDEAHHCLSDSYQRVLSHFPDANVLGVTATPDRGDKKNLAQFFDSCAFEYSMRDAIKDGFLCPIKAQMIPLRLDIHGVKQSAGDFAVGDIGHALDPYLTQIAEEMVKICKNKKTVVFLPLVSTAQKFRDILISKGIRAAEVNGKSTDRTEVLSDFDAGKYDVLCNAMLLTEGWDCPSVDCIVVLRPTKIRSLYVQMVGRGTRPAPGKKELLILDFLWLTTRHDLCRPSALVAKSDEVKEKIDDIIEKNEGGLDIMDVEESAKRDIAAEREKALAEELKEKRNRKGKLVDPTQYVFSIGAEDLDDFEPLYAWQAEPASEKQLATLERYGIKADEVKNKGEAHILIDRLKARQRAGLARPRQIKFLERKGFVHVGDWSFEAANNMISRISDNHWHVPYGIIPVTYRPNEDELA